MFLMRRLFFSTAFALLLSVSLWAQRAGHGGGFGGHAGFVGGHVGGGFGGRAASFAGHSYSGAHIGNGRFYGGMRSGFSRGSAHAYNRGLSGHPYLHDRFRNGFHDRDHDRFRDREFHGNCYGYGCWGGYGYGYPWWGAYYDPFAWDWNYDDAQFDADYNNNLAQADEMNEQSLEQQQMLRQEEEDRDQDLYAANHPPSSQHPDYQQGTPIAPPTVLVFRDHHQQEIQNYAIVGQTLWVLGSTRNQKVPLAELDLPATEKANDDRGVTFQPPRLDEGQ
jgi:hypothetical protein